VKSRLAPMLPETFRRFIASSICALSAGLLLLASLTVCRALDSNIESMLGDRNKLPLVTLWFQQSIPENGWVLLFGFWVLVIGYGCLAWTHRVSAFLAAFHALLGFFALSGPPVCHSSESSSGFRKRSRL
jgi:hypothetical protein